MIAIAVFVAGTALLFFGGTWLVSGATSLASRAGISPLAIGLTVVAFGTSMPELVVSLDAAFAGSDDIAIGNVVGSNIANIALILALAAILRPSTVDPKVLKVDAPIMILATLAVIVFVMDGTVSRVEGGILLLCLIAFTLFTFWQSWRNGQSTGEQAEEAGAGITRGGAASLALVIAGLLALLLGGHMVVTGAVSLAASLGLSEAVVGLTIVAVGTSLPEASTSIVAAVRGQGDIAVGNVVGSNIFNVLGILGTTSLVTPLGLGNISYVDLGTMVALALMLALMLLTHLRLSRVEGAVLLASYCGYIAYRIWQ